MSTFHQTTVNGIPITVPNTTTDGVGYYVSFNDYDINIYGCETTAIVVSNPTNFLIINGDHREQLKGLSREQACGYFHENCELKNHMSDPHEDHILVIPKQ